MFDLKVINSVIDQMSEERGIGREKMLDAIEQALATAYKKEYGKRGQIVRAHFDLASGSVEFAQIKIAVDETMVRLDEPITEEERPDDAHAAGGTRDLDQRTSGRRPRPHRGDVRQEAGREVANLAFEQG